MEDNITNENDKQQNNIHFLRMNKTKTTIKPRLPICFSLIKPTYYINFKKKI